MVNFDRRIIKRYGYKRDQQGIMNRYLRENGGWDRHLIKCREYILESIKLNKPKRVSVLGSGWLLDIPLEEMRKSVNEIYLVDIIHPTQILHKVKKLEGVNIVVEDITGGTTNNLLEYSEKNLPGGDLVIKEYSPSFEPGMVLSVNILTQLDSLLTERFGSASDQESEQINKIRKKIQEQHINFLNRNRSLLITEYFENIYRDSELVNCNSLIFTNLPEGKDMAEWDWEFDTTGSYYKERRVIFKVKAMRLN